MTSERTKVAFVAERDLPRHEVPGARDHRRTVETKGAPGELLHHLREQTGEGGGNDLVAAVLGALAEGLVEAAVAHAAVNIMHALDVGSIRGDAHHLAVDGRHQDVSDGKPVSRIELIPPVHQRVYRMGLEHLGVVVGEEFDEFSRVHRAVLTGQQFQSADVDPVYVLFEDFTHVKFYRRSFFDVVEDEAGRFEGFVHVDDWVPQQLATATGPNPLPR